MERHLVVIIPGTKYEQILLTRMCRQYKIKYLILMRVINLNFKN